MLVVPVTDIDAFKRGLSRWEYRNKETEIGSNEQEASLSAGKNTRVVLVPCPTGKSDPAATSEYSRGSRCHLLWEMSFQFFSEGHKKYSKEQCLINSQSVFLIFTSILTEWNGHIIKSM